MSALWNPRPFSKVAISVIYLVVWSALDLSATFFETSPGVSAWYPPHGASIFLLLRYGLSFWPLLFVGPMINGSLFWFKGQTVPLLILSFSIMAWYALGVWVLTRFRFDRRFASLRDVLLFVMVMTLASFLVALSGIGNMVAFGLLGKDIAVRKVLDFWAGDTLGVLVFAPALLMWLQPKAEAQNTPTTDPAGSARQSPLLLSWGEFRPLAIPLVFGVFLAAATQWTGAVFAHPPSYFMLLPILWAAFTGGCAGAALTALFVNIAYILCGVLSGTTMSVTDVQLFMFTASVCGLVFGSVSEEGRRSERAREHAQTELQLTEKANAAKSVFLANMSHEIRTPLGAILGFTELLMDKPAPAEKETQLYLATIHRNGTELLKLINDILDLSKVESGKFEIHREPVSLKDLISDVLTTLAPKSQEKNLQLSLNFDESLPEIIYSDPSRLRQVLLNMVGNAIKFTNAGFVTVKAEWAVAPTLEESLALPAAPRAIAIAIKDSGVGFRSEESKRIFQPFEQIDNSPVRRYGGTGLGLFLSRRLMQSMGGDVSLQESAPGKGSTFVVKLLTDLPQLST